MRNLLLFGIPALVLVLWLGWTFYASGNLETPRYTVLGKRDGFEIRRYEPYIVAQVQVEGDYQQALNQGFRRLAGYIFGGNAGSRSLEMTAPVTEGQGEKIAMTAPVTEQPSQKIAMTAPVTERDEAGLRTISFMMPSEYSLESLPTPNDPGVQFVQMPAQVRAVSGFSWYATAGRVAKQKRALAERVAKSGLEPQSEPVFASYNDPFSFPLLMKHEIWIDVDAPDAG
jgi:hypothetical protein